MSQRPVEDMLSRLPNAKQSGESWTSCCPNHDDQHKSLSIKEGRDGRVLVKCFAGCKTAEVVEKLGMRMRDLFPPRSGGGRGRKPQRSLSVAELAADKGLPEDFLKELGVVSLIDLFDRQMVRITYRRADGTLAPRQRIRTALRAKEGSLWSKGNAPLVPYGLWKLSEAGRTGYLILPEGESDAWTLWHHGFPALGIPGADMVKTLEAAHLEGVSRLYVVQEPDRGGETFVAGIARRLKQFGWSGKAYAIKLEGAKDPNELHKQNPEAFKTAFQKVLDSADPLPEAPPDASASGEPSPAGVGPNGALPLIDAGNLDLKVVSAEAWAAIRSANREPARWFRYGGIAARIEADDEARPITREINQDRLRHILARVARWVHIERDEEGNVTETAPALPPMHVVKDMLADPDIPLPILMRLVEAPVFASDGRLEVGPGYHEASRTYYAPAAGFMVPPVPEAPSSSDIEKARGLLDELLCDFPFVGPAERAHAVALLLLPHARDLIEGATPLHLIEAPSPGTGKTLLSDILTYPAAGRPVTTMTEGRDEDEWRKRITAKLMRLPAMVMIDNLRRRLDSPAVSAAITSPTWEDRVLGESKIVSLPVRCVWMATGNNPGLSSEMARRTIRIRLDAKQDRPWLRQGFRHPNLRDWIREQRASLVWASLTIIRAWLLAGRPLFRERSLGMFEEWGKTIGGILRTVGIDGFLSNLEEFYEDSDAEGNIWRGLVRAWWERFGSDEVGAAELFEVANSLDEPLDLGKGTEKSQKTRLGQELIRLRDRRFEDLRVVLAGQRQRAKRWKLVSTKGGEPVNVSEPLPPSLAAAGAGVEELPLSENGEKGSPGFTGSQPDELLALSSHPTEWPPYWRDLFEERAAILELENGFTRQDAEARAEEIVRDVYAQETRHAGHGKTQ